MNKPCCYCWQIYDERDKHECIGSLRAQRDRLLEAVYIMRLVLDRNQLVIDGMKDINDLIDEAEK